MMIEHKPTPKDNHEVEMHRAVINETCRDFHGIINEFKVRDYIETKCENLTDLQQESLKYHLNYSRDHDKSKRKQA